MTIFKSREWLYNFIKYILLICLLLSTPVILFKFIVLMRVKEESKKSWLETQLKKTKIMACGPITSWQIERERVEALTDFTFLGSKLTVDCDCSHGIKRRLFLGKKAMINLVYHITCLLGCFSHVRLFVTPWTVACQTFLSMRFSGQEYWNGLPCPPPGDLPNPGIEPESPALQGDSLPAELSGKPK